MSITPSSRTIVFSSSVNEHSVADLLGALSSMSTYEDEPVYLIINSSGGALDDAIGVYDYLKSSSLEVHGLVYGQASSAAVLILQGCDVRLIGENSIVMVHAGSIGIDSRHPEETVRQIATSMDLFNRSKKILAKECGVSLKLMQKRMKYASSYVGQQAVDAGFADAVIKTKDKRK